MNIQRIQVDIIRTKAAVTWSLVVSWITFLIVL